jgi:hypothetical protein
MNDTATTATAWFSWPMTPIMDTPITDPRHWCSIFDAYAHIKRGGRDNGVPKRLVHLIRLGRVCARPNNAAPRPIQHKRARKLRTLPPRNAVMRGPRSLRGD